MFKFYGKLLVGTCSRFRKIMTPWRFWGWIGGFVALGIMALFFPEWKERLHLPNMSPWYILILIALLAAYCLLRENYERFDELQKQIRGEREGEEEKKERKEKRIAQQAAVDALAQLRAEAVQLYANSPSN